MAIKISHVSVKSIFYPLGIRKGDKIISINGKPVCDNYGVIKESERRAMKFQIERKDGSQLTYRVAKEQYSDILMEFEEDSLKRCANRCIFCFIDQNPQGLRDSLYIKDDDYRYSLEYGSFITLSNMSKLHIRNIIEHSLSPLYISVHSSEEGVRKKMFGRENSLNNLEELLHAGIKIHAQIVLVRGVNDGVHLLKTLDYAKQKGFLTTGIVPCGLTAHRKGLYRIEEMDPDYMNEVIETVENWKIRSSFKRVYLADEFFLKTTGTVPGRRYYGKFEQIENGIGMTRDFADETADLSKMKLKRGYAVLTGGLFGRFLTGQKYFGGERIYIAENRFMGGNVETAGLLSGSDIVRACRKIDEKNIILTSSMFNGDGLTIDGMNRSGIEKRSGKRLHIINEYTKIRKYICP